MAVRFFNDPSGEERLLIGISADHLTPAEMHEAVRVATPEDVQMYGSAYAAYVAEFKSAGEGEQATVEGQPIQPGDAGLTAGRESQAEERSTQEHRDESSSRDRRHR